MKKMWHSGECGENCRSSQINFFSSFLAVILFSAALYFFRDLVSFIRKILVVGLFTSVIFFLLFRPSSWVPFRKPKKCPQCGSYWMESYYLLGEVKPFELVAMPNSQFIYESAPVWYVVHCRRCGYGQSENRGTWGNAFEKKKEAS